MPGTQQDLVVGVGDCRVSADPNTALVTHALGSCIAVAVHDPAVRVGGLLHFLLPEASLNEERAQTQPYLFADTGIPELFRSLMALGADPDRASVWVVGGAQVMDPNGVFNVGRRNYAACRRILANAGLAVHGEAVGGSISRTVRLGVGDGGLRWSSRGGQWHLLRKETSR